MYGATEGSARLSYLAPNKFMAKIDSIGKAIPGVTLRVLDEEGRELPPNQAGELVAAGPNIMKGYWKDPEATERVLDDKGYHTGDLAYRDEDGFFHIVGRKDHLLKVGGHRLNPSEIEDVVMESGHVIETIVLGIPDPVLGHKLAALVTPKNNGISESELLRYCAKNLPKYKLPCRVKFISRFPYKTSGKIDRTKCFEMLTKF